MKQRRRTALANVGGRCALWGQTELAQQLAFCLSVEPIEKLPWTHGFHAYPARMHPEIARRALAFFTPKRVLDPFVGSGTTALEAVRSGLNFVGGDISRVALEIAWARTRIWPPERCRQVERQARRLARSMEGPLPEWAHREAEWYAPHTLREICVLKRGIDGIEDSDLRRMLTCVLSSIVVKLSRQESDSVVAKARAMRFWPPRAAYRLFSDKCSELTRSLLILSSDLHKRRVAFVEPEFRLEDARMLRLPAASVDLVLTSPPYPGTYDYSLHHARRYPLFGDDGRLVADAEIGSKRGGGDFGEDLRRCLERMKEALTPEGRMCLLIGDGWSRGAAVLADRLVIQAAARVGAVVLAGASQERVERSFDKRGRRKREHLICLRFR